MISLVHRSIGYEALVLFVIVLAACLAAYRLLLAPPSADRARRQRPPARAAAAPLLCKRPGCSARANPANGVLVCDAHMELLLCLREDARLEMEDEAAWR